MNKTTARMSKYVIIGIILTICSFTIYTFLARIVINNNIFLWIASAISCIFATILAYFLHSKITWQERPVTKHGRLMFFVWNGLSAIAIAPFFTWLFGFTTPIYELAYNIFTTIHIPFDYSFVESTGIFCLTTLVTMVLNYLFYDKLVFGDSVKTPIQNSVTPSSTKVSIIVPIYNTAKYLPKCLTSITKPTHHNLEIILVDDGSTDESGKIADEYAKKDKRIKVIHQKNAGQSTARNTGLEKASGNYISFIDADDEIAPTFVESLLHAYTPSTSLSVCGLRYKRLKLKTTNNVYVNILRSRKSHESTKAYILYLLAIDGRMYSSVNKLYIAKIAKTIKFDKSLNFAEDTKFVLDYLKRSKGEPAFVLEPLYIYNFGTETSTIRSTATNWQNWQTSYHNLKSWLGKNPTLREKFWLHLVHLRWRISYIHSKKRAKS